MSKIKHVAIIWLFGFFLLLPHNVAAQEEFDGTLISFNGPRVETAFFKLIINARTSNEQAKQFLDVLQREGQNDLLQTINDENLGTFSVGNAVGRRVNVVRESTVDGRRRIFVVFERWTRFAELRGGYRSLDYPFGVIELFIDERTGKGEGTYIAAARIRWEREEQQVEIENFATYPVKMTNVTSRERRRQR